MPADQRESKRRPWRTLALLYLALLVLSHGVAWLRQTAPERPANVRAAKVQVVEGHTRGTREVEVAYRVFGNKRSTDFVPMLFLHGSPGDSESLVKLANAFAPGRRLYAPDFPGFGHSTRDVPDYSVEAHAEYVVQFLEALEIESVDVLAFSMGGGVAVHLASRAPERVRSIAYVASIGVQETELFGNYLLNHAVHGLQLAAIRGAQLLLPHFGALDDDFPLNVPYARNFYDTDQRPLRELLGRIEQPFAIIHGERDFLVMPETAREHHRIVPHSELTMLDTSHFLVWTMPHEVAGLVEGFFERVDRGEALSRGQASEERQARAREPWNAADAPRFEGPALLVAFLLLAAATLVSEDLTCIGAGLLVAQGRLGFVTATLACFVGIFVGDMLLYLAGRWLGRPALKRAPLRFVVTPAGVVRATHWFEARGAGVIFLSRFLPGLRLPTYVAAGILRMRFGVFALYFLLAGIVWTPILVGSSTWLGARALDYLESFERWALPGILGIAFGILLLQRLIVPLFTFRGRRLLLASWRRKRHFEFWHPVVFYIPVALYIAWLALRYRSLTVITAANPGIPTGGFIGESKSEILDALAGAGDAVARHVLIPAAAPAEERAQTALSFMQEAELDYPIVFKPDVGQRGSGVCILHDRPALEAAVRDMRVDCILQEFAAGPEYGVFWIRHPDAERGEIFSVTEKRLPEVTGDGEHSLEELILRDDRAVCAAHAYFEANAERLGEVPARGEAVQLVELGTHCRGAVFYDGAGLVTPELAERIETISNGFEGFWFGRYDLRASSEEALRAGRGFKILELNGLTSEATHVYDPRHTLVAAYRTLMRQWRLAFEIGAANRARGAQASSIRELFRAWRSYQSLQRSHPGNDNVGEETLHVDAAAEQAGQDETQKAPNLAEA